jgi:CheY-like chemotaxis protein
LLASAGFIMPHAFDSVPATILVIEDQGEVLTGLASILSGAGYRCHCSSSAAAARKLAAEVLPDLIISDINLSGASVPALCDQIRQQPGLAAVPVMFLSAAQTPDIIRRCDAGGGGVYYLRRPFDPQVILELIDKALPAVISH